jgi:hypothetical protein
MSGIRLARGCGGGGGFSGTSAPDFLFKKSGEAADMVDERNPACAGMGWAEIESYWRRVRNSPRGRAHLETLAALPLVMFFIEQEREHGFCVEQLIGFDHAEGLGEREELVADDFVVIGRIGTGGEVFGEIDLHPLSEEAGAGVITDEFLPAACAVAGLLRQLTASGGQRLFAGLDAAGGQLPEVASGGVAVLALQQNLGLAGARILDGEDDDRSVMADDVFYVRRAAGLGDDVGVDVEDFAVKDTPGGEHADLGRKLAALAGHATDGRLAAGHESSRLEIRDDAGDEREKDSSWQF